MQGNHKEPSDEIHTAKVKFFLTWLYYPVIGMTRGWMQMLHSYNQIKIIPVQGYPE